MTPRSRLNSIFCNRLSRSATRWTSSFQDGMRFQLAITQGLDQLEYELRVVLFDFLRHAAHQNNTRAGTVPHSAGRYRGGRCRSVNPEGLGFNDDSREKGPRLGNWLEFGASPFIPTV